MAEGSSSKIDSIPVHLSGLTKLCFSPDGQTIFTAGTDCLVRIFKADEPDAEPGFYDEHTDEVTSLSCSSSSLITASKDNIARVFSYPQNEFKGYITRSTGVAIRWVSIEPSGERVAVCGDDLLVKIVHVDATERVTLLSDSTKPVRSASWDPTGTYLVTASCDGKLRIYDVKSPTPILLKIMEGVIAPSESDSETSCYAVWHPKGEYFVIPTRTNEVGIIHRDGWSKGHTFVSDGPRAPFGEVSWSPNGKYLAASSGSDVVVWSTESRAVVAKQKHDGSNISALSFSPTSNFIAYASLDGSFSRWTSPIPSNLTDPVKTEAATAKALDKLLDDDFGDDFDDELEEKGEDLDDALDGADDWIVDDDGLYSAEDGERARPGRTEVVNVTKAQEPFAPGSTAMKNKKRYLAFNMIGVVDVTDQETHYVINVEFHDKIARRGYHFQDHTKYSMAALGEQGIVYAAPSQDGQASTVYYRPYDSWASQADWTISLLQGENALCVAAGGAAGDGMGSVVVATSKGYVRFFSSSGIQRYLWRIGEEAISMAASRDTVFIVHREGGTSLDGYQNLRYSILDLESFELVQEGRIPLPRKTTLQWVGFTAEGSPAIYDSTGLLSILDRFRRPGQARWVPLLDSNLLARKQGRTESYWPVGVTNTHFTCIILKGSEKEPWFPRPLIQELDMQMPLLNLDNQQGKLEESVMRGELALTVMSDNLQHGEDDGTLEHSIKAREVSLDKELLQLVQSACKADNLQRALDMTRLMHNPATVDAAGKVAAFYHLPGLQERIAEVRNEVDYRRLKERRSRRAAATNAPNGREQPKNYADFAPKASRRSFGGVGAGGIRDTTPALSGRSMDTFIPETPESQRAVDNLAAEGSVSPESKRRRIDETPVDDFALKPRVQEASTLSSAKNPFAKKPASANPFAKPAVAKPLDAIKSTSFFDRVDDIESSGVKAKKSKKEKMSVPMPGPKQTTLFGMKKNGGIPPKPVHQDSGVSTETEVDEVDADEEMEETQVDERHILEETRGQEVLSPQSMEE